MESQLMYEDAQLTHEETPPSPDVLAAEPKKRVLVVEDDPDMRRLVALVLRREGYKVIEADDGLGLLASLQSAMWNERKEPIDAIVSDIQMPDLTAIEVLQALPGRHAGTPVVLMTAYGAERTRAEARALGAVAVLDKPLDWEKFRLAVQNAIALGAAAPGIDRGGPHGASVHDLGSARVRRLS